ncbi:Pyruvate/Phosphoenolpyruvate kinase-like domain-containing protein [Mycena sanguinolenta]|nr:Pyruvate/Phosphoenolpyruvate kinase-like domain-containing protein [Mycena sanguinolenta]
MSTAFRFTTDPSTQSSWAAPTLQQSGNMRGLIDSGKVLLGQVLSYPSRQVAKTLAVTGADWTWIDAEHVAWSPKLLVECIQIVIHESAGRQVVVAWALDAGAGGIIIPHIETSQEVAEVVKACRFPPTGHRSFPPFTYVSLPSFHLCFVVSERRLTTDYRVGMQIPGVTDTTPSGESVFSLANKHIAIIPQVESRLGIKNIDTIMQMEEVDAVMIGSGDLRLDMGLSAGFVGDEPQFVAAIDHASAMSKKYGKPLAALALNPEMIKERLSQGFRVLINCIDLATLAFGTIKELGTARETVEDYLSCKQSLTNGGGH